MKEAKHISENFRLITPIISIYVAISVSIMGFFFMKFYEKQETQGVDIIIIKEKISWLEGRFGFKFGNLTVTNASEFIK